MRRTVGFILLGLAGFLVTAAILALVWVPGQVKKTPLDVVTDTRLTGSAAALPTGGGGPVKYLSRTVADGAASSSDVVVFDNFTCLVSDPDGTAPDCVDDTDPDKRLVSAGTDRFATDRVTALAVNDEKYVGVNAVPHEGLVNKFPFDTKKKDYPFWDDVLGDTVVAQYDGTDTIDGLDVYKFSYSVADADAEIATGVDGTYSMDKTMWIEPKTGQIIDQEQHDVRSANGTTLLDVELSFTDDQVQTNVDDAKANLSSLDLITSTVPLIGFILGPLLLIAGAIGLMLSRRSEDQPVSGGHATPRTPAHNS